MTKQRKARINPVLLLPACLFGTRLIHGLIFRPNHNGEVKEQLEEEVVEVVANEECSESVEQGSVGGGRDDDGLEEVSNNATWETLSLDSEASNASSVGPVTVPPMESCSRSVLMNDWLRGLKLCHPPRYAEKWGVDLGAGVHVPAQHLERQMERAQCFMNPMYHMLQGEEPQPQSLQPPTIPAVCAPMNLPSPTPKKMAVKFPEVEPFTLGKHRALSAGTPRGGFTSRSDGAYEVTAPKRKTRLNFKSSSTLSVAGTPRTPRRLCSPPRCVTPIAAQAWVRSNSRNGVDYRNFIRPRDSAEDMYLSVRRVEVASTS